MPGSILMSILEGNPKWQKRVGMFIHVSDIYHACSIHVSCIYLANIVHIPYMKHSYLVYVSFMFHPPIVHGHEMISFRSSHTCDMCILLGGGLPLGALRAYGWAIYEGDPKGEAFFRAYPIYQRRSETEHWMGSRRKAWSCGPLCAKLSAWSHSNQFEKAMSS